MLLLVAGCGPDRSRPVAGLPSTTAAVQEDHGELIAELEELRRNGRHREGLSAVRRQLELSPGAALLHFQLGLLLQQTGELDAAEAAMARTLELEPAHYPSYRVLGDLARLRGAPAPAAGHYQRCLSGLPDHAGCRYGLALALVDLGDLDAAAGHLVPAAEQLDRAEVWSELGQLERRRRRLGKSIAAFSQAFALDRVHLPTLLGMGQVLVAAGREDEGRALLERHRQEAAKQDEIDALRRAANQPEAPAKVLIQLARLYRLRGDTRAVEAALREALQRSPAGDPLRPAAALGLANHLAHHGDATEADRLVETFMPQMAGNPAVLFLQGTIDLALGDAVAARAHFDASLAEGPWPPSVYLDAGKAWSRAGFPEPAAAAFERALAGLPDSAEAHLGLARSRRAQGAAGQALESAYQALKLDPSLKQVWLLIGVLETELGEPEAFKAFSAGLEARKLDLLPAAGAEEIRRELEALDPPDKALELFDLAVDHRREQP